MQESGEKLEATSSDATQSQADTDAIAASEPVIDIDDDKKKEASPFWKKTIAPIIAAAVSALVVGLIEEYRLARRSETIEQLQDILRAQKETIYMTRLVRCVQHEMLLSSQKDICAYRDSIGRAISTCLSGIDELKENPAISDTPDDDLRLFNESLSNLRQLEQTAATTCR